MVDKPTREGTNHPAIKDRRRMALWIGVVVVVLLIVVPAVLLAAAGGIGGNIVQVTK